MNANTASVSKRRHLCLMTRIRCSSSKGSKAENIAGRHWAWPVMLPFFSWSIRSATRMSRSSASFRRAAPTAMKENDMSDKLVRMTVDLSKPRTLTDAQREELRKLAEMRDEDIDYSDIPPADFSNAILFRDRHLYKHLFKPIKQSTTVRIDADVLLWLRAKGRGYQTRINAILREAMAKEGG